VNDQAPKKWTVGRVIAWIVAIALIGSGLIAIGFFLLMSIAMANYGSNK
jgi:hypothetical protein